MGEMTSGESPADLARQDTNPQTDYSDDGFDTDVDGVKAHGERLGLPVFNVDRDEFYQNMNYGRKRLRFKSGTPVQAYMQGTRYKRPFWIAYKDKGGQEYIRKVK
jgi:hypothetical protein